MPSPRRTLSTARPVLVFALLALAALVAPIALAGDPPGTTGGHGHGPGHAHEGCPFAAQMPADRAGAAPAAALPSLPGQDAFGAIQEIVALLDADPATDWRTVDVRALRDHLVDMNEVVLNAAVTETAVDGGIEAAVTGTGRTLAALRRMLPAHARMLGMEEPGLRAAWRETDGGGVLSVTADDPAAVARLRGLGFYGVMALGDHHRRHHLAIAAGRMHH